MNFTCGGGSSSVFSSALNAAVLSMWTSSMMIDLERPARRGELHLVAQVAHLVDAVVRGAVDLQHVQELPAAISRHMSHRRRASPGCPFSQFSALAKMRASDGLADAARPHEQIGVRHAALPGIGPYTLAAVGSLAYGWPLAVVDGNVVRVLSRLFARPAREPARYRALAQALLWPDAAGACNEAWMELGALVCLPRRPKCGGCPLRALCAARAEGRPEAYPPARPRRTPPHYVVGAAVTFNARGAVLVAQRKADAMLGGLWEFPGGKVEPGETLPDCIRREIREELGCEVEVGAPLLTVRHAYSHFTIELHAYRCRLAAGRPRPIHCADVAWRPVARLRELAFSRADLHIVDRLWRDAGLPGAQALGQTRRSRISRGSALASSPARARSSSGRSSRPTVS
jgi:mutator protein MutT